MFYYSGGNTKIFPKTFFIRPLYEEDLNKMVIFTIFIIVNTFIKATIVLDFQLQIFLNTDHAFKLLINEYTRKMFAKTIKSPHSIFAPENSRIRSGITFEFLVIWFQKWVPNRPVFRKTILIFKIFFGFTENINKFPEKRQFFIDKSLSPPNTSKMSGNDKSIQGNIFQFVFIQKQKNDQNDNY